MNKDERFLFQRTLVIRREKSFGIKKGKSFSTLDDQLGEQFRFCNEIINQAGHRLRSRTVSLVFMAPGYLLHYTLPWILEF